MGRGINGLGGGVWGEVRWQVGQSWQKRFTGLASGNGLGCVGWCFGLLSGRPLDARAPTPSRSQSWPAVPPTEFFPPPFTVRHSKAGHSGRWSEVSDGALAGSPFPRSLSLVSSSTWGDRHLLENIIVKVRGFGGGLTVSRTVWCQQHGASAGILPRLPSTAVPGGTGRLGGGGEKVVKTWPVSPEEHGDGQVFHNSNFNWPGSVRRRDVYPPRGHLSRVTMDAGDGQDGLWLGSWGKDGRLYKARVKESLKRSSIHLHTYAHGGPYSLPVKPYWESGVVP